MNAQPELEAVAQEAATTLSLTFGGFCGKGAFKETYRAIQPDGTVVALKLVDRTKIDEVRTSREIEALQRCNTAHIAKFIKRQDYKTTDGRVFDLVVEEFLDGGSLEERMQQRSLTQGEVVELIRGLVLGLRELYPLQLVHRDIKPANVMFRAGRLEPVLVDFGLVRDLAQTSLTLSWLPHGPGTPLFAPPEQLNNEKSLINWRADQFAVGVVASFALLGRHPYQIGGMNPTETVFAVSERRGLAPEFCDDMKRRGLQTLITMVRPWPVQRFSNPDLLLKELEQ